MSYEQFKQYLRKNPLPLSDVEERAVQWAKHHAAQHIVGLGNKVDVDTGNVLIEADAQLRQETKRAIREKVSLAVEARKTNKELKSDLGWMMGDWSRDWDRIAITELSDAFSHAAADQIEEEEGDDALVFRRPMPDACAHCKRLHLGPDGAPRLFKLSTLRANGTNYKKKTSQWQATVGPIHPHCQCTLEHMPPGWGFNAEGEMWPGGEFGVVYGSEADVKKALAEEETLQKAIGDGRAFFQGIPIYIESPAGSVRKWSGGETRMLLPYGYVKRTGALDEDELDVYLGPDPKAEFAYIVMQNDPETGTVDEHKVFLGLSNKELARQYFLAHRDDGEEALFDITPVPMDQFKRWIAGTEAAPGHMFQKSTRNELALVIPIQKSLGSDVTTTPGTFKGSQGVIPPGKSADRGTGPGVGMNFYIPAPMQHKQQPDDDLIEEARKLKQGREIDGKKPQELIEESGLVRDQSIWDMPEPVEIRTHDQAPYTEDLNAPVDEAMVEGLRAPLDERTAANVMEPHEVPNTIVEKRSYRKLKKAGDAWAPTLKGRVFQKSELRGERARVQDSDGKTRVRTVWRHESGLYREV